MEIQNNNVDSSQLDNGSTTETDNNTITDNGTEMETNTNETNEQSNINTNIQDDATSGNDSNLDDTTTNNSSDDDVVDYGESPDLPVGKEIKLKNTDVYMRWFNKKPAYQKSGTYYIYDDRIKEERIRVCASADACQVNGRVTGWVNIKDIIDNSNIEVGDKVVVKGSLTVMADGSGNKITKNETIMYVTDVLEDKVQFPNYIGVSIEPLSARQGWGNDDIISKYIDTSIIRYNDR